MTYLWSAALICAVRTELSQKTRAILSKQSLRPKNKASAFENQSSQPPICKIPTQPIELFPYSFWSHQPQSAGVAWKLQPGEISC